MAPFYINHTKFLWLNFLLVIGTITFPLIAFCLILMFITLKYSVIKFIKYNPLFIIVTFV